MSWCEKNLGSLLLTSWRNNHTANFRDNKKIYGKYTNVKQQNKTNRKKYNEKSHFNIIIINGKLSARNFPVHKGIWITDGPANCSSLSVPTSCFTSLQNKHIRMKEHKHKGQGPQTHIPQSHAI
jgi:hypothetical protein